MATRIASSSFDSAVKVSQSIGSISDEELLPDPAMLRQGEGGGADGERTLEGEWTRRVGKVKVEVVRVWSGWDFFGVKVG